MDIAASARKHGVPDHVARDTTPQAGIRDRHPAVTMFIGPSTRTEPLEVGVVTDDEGAAIIHVMKAREKFLRAWWTK